MEPRPLASRADIDEFWAWYSEMFTHAIYVPLILFVVYAIVRCSLLPFGDEERSKMTPRDIVVKKTLAVCLFFIALLSFLLLMVASMFVGVIPVPIYIQEFTLLGLSVVLPSYIVPFNLLILASNNYWILLAKSPPVDSHYDSHQPMVRLVVLAVAWAAFEANQHLSVMLQLAKFRERLNAPKEPESAAPKLAVGAPPQSARKSRKKKKAKAVATNEAQ